MGQGLDRNKINISSQRGWTVEISYVIMVKVRV